MCINYMTERSGRVTPESDDAQAAANGLGTKDRTDRSNYPASSDIDQHLDVPRQRPDDTAAKAGLLELALEPFADGAWQVLTQFGQPSILQGRQAIGGLVLACRALIDEFTGTAKRRSARGGDHHG